MRHLDFVSQFTSDIRYIKGSKNPVADALSRVSVNAVQPSIDFKKLAADEQEDSELSELMAFSTSLELSPVPLQAVDTTVICDLSTGVPRPFVPVSFRRAVFESLHSLSHPGIRAIQKLITARYVWPGINADVRRWARSCLMSTF